MLSESGADKPPYTFINDTCIIIIIIQPPLSTYGCMRNIYLPCGLTYMAGSTIDTWVWLALVHLLITVITSIGRKAVTAVCPYEVLQTRQGRERSLVNRLQPNLEREVVRSNGGCIHTLQDPPFSQGELAHSLISVSQSSPVYPMSHLHV